MSRCPDLVFKLRAALPSQYLLQLRGKTVMKSIDINGTVFRVPWASILGQRKSYSPPANLSLHAKKKELCFGTFLINNLFVSGVKPDQI